MSETQQYQFSSKPMAVAASRKDKAKGGYRKEEEEKSSFNIMFDPRVYRGSTYSSHTREKLQAQQEQTQKESAKKAALVKKKKDQYSEPHLAHQALPPAPGRKDTEIQTDTYLEELTDRVPETEMETQTDPFSDRPSLPLFIPTKSGVDAETQVDVDELFDFDAEVEPILEVLVGKTLEHAMMEVVEEEELSNIRQHQAEFEQERNVERAQVQRLEAEAIRRNEERRRRIAQEEERLVREALVMEKVASRAFVDEFMDGMQESTFEKLVRQGTFYDPLTKEIEEAFLPWLISSAQQGSEERMVANALTDELIRRTLEKARDKFGAYKQQIADKRKQQEEDLLRQLEERRAAEEAAAQEQGAGDAEPQEASD